MITMSYFEDLETLNPQDEFPAGRNEGGIFEDVILRITTLR
jgi:hypothetical protein